MLYITDLQSYDTATSNIINLARNYVEFMDFQNLRGFFKLLIDTRKRVISSISQLNVTLERNADICFHVISDKYVQPYFKAYDECLRNSTNANRVYSEVSSVESKLTDRAKLILNTADKSFSLSSVNSSHPKANRVKGVAAQFQELKNICTDEISKSDDYANQLQSLYNTYVIKSQNMLYKICEQIMQKTERAATLAQNIDAIDVACAVIQQNELWSFDKVQKYFDDNESVITSKIRTDTIDYLNKTGGESIGRA